MVGHGSSGKPSWTVTGAGVGGLCSSHDKRQLLSTSLGCLLGWGNQRSEEGAGIVHHALAAQLGCFPHHCGPQPPHGFWQRCLGSLGRVGFWQRCLGLPWPGRCCDFTRPCHSEKNLPTCLAKPWEEPRGTMGLVGVTLGRRTGCGSLVSLSTNFGGPCSTLDWGGAPSGLRGHPFPLLWAFTSLRTPSPDQEVLCTQGSICPKASGPGERIGNN